MASSAVIADDLLEWPPDVVALTNVILARSEAFRFALSPIQEWPPEGDPDWGRMVQEGGLRWGAWVEHRRSPPPKVVGQQWTALKERVDVPLEHLARVARSTTRPGSARRRSDRKALTPLQSARCTSPQRPTPSLC